MNLLWRDGEMRELPAKCRLTIRHGDVFRHVLGGAGGWADRDASIFLTLQEERAKVQVRLPPD